MNFFSLARRLQWKFRDQSRRSPQSRSRKRLTLEQLEVRETPAAPSVLSVNTASIGPNPGNVQITINFSEAMNPADASLASNYLLYASDGSRIPILQTVNNIPGGTPAITYTDIPATPSSPAQHVTTITNAAISLPNATSTYNHQLTADTYTLFIEGDQIADVTNTQFVSPPGSVVVANQGKGGGNLSTLSFTDGLGENPTGSDSVGGLTNSTVAGATFLPGTTLPASIVNNPIQVLVADLDGRTTSTGSAINDLIILNGDGNSPGGGDSAAPNADTVQIYLGVATGGFESSPTLTLPLDKNGGPAQMALGDFLKGNLSDNFLLGITVVEKTANRVRIFVNKTGNTGLTFTNTPIVIGAGQSLAPDAITVGHFNNTKYLDIAVACSALDSNKFYDVGVIIAGADAQYATPTFLGAPRGDPYDGDYIRVGENSNTGQFGIQSPYALTTASIYNTPKSGLDDMVVGAANRVSVLFDEGGSTTTIQFESSQHFVIVGNARFYLFPFLELDTLPGSINTTVGTITAAYLQNPATSSGRQDIILSEANSFETLLNDGADFSSGAPPLLPTNNSDTAAINGTPPGTVGPHGNGLNLTNVVAQDMNGDSQNDIVYGSGSQQAGGVNVDSLRTGYGTFDGTSVTSASPHDMVVGEEIQIFEAILFPLIDSIPVSFIVPGSTPPAQTGGLYYVASVTDSNHFTIAGAPGQFDVSSGQVEWESVPGGISTVGAPDATDAVPQAVGAPIIIEAPTDGMVTGEQITLSGFTGAAATKGYSGLTSGLNSTFFITVISPNEFQLNGTTWTPSPTTAPVIHPGVAFWSPSYSSITTSNPTEPLPTSVAVGDVNQDGVPDVVALSTQSDVVSTYKQQVSSGPITSVGGAPGTPITITLNSPIQTTSPPALTSPPPLVTGRTVAIDNVYGYPQAQNPATDNNFPITINGADPTHSSFTLGVGNNQTAATGVTAPQTRGAFWAVGTGVLLAGTSTTPTSSASTFTLPSGSTPSSVVVTDLNSDGIPDLVTVDPATGEVYVFLGLVGGGYQAALNSPYQVSDHTGSDPVSVAVGNLTGHQPLPGSGLVLQDLVVANQNDATVQILTAQLVGGRLTYTRVLKPVPVGASPYQVVTGHFFTNDYYPDGEPILDLAVAHSGFTTVNNLPPGGVDILVNNSDGSFQPAFDLQSPGSTFEPQSLVVADFTDPVSTTNGNQDIVVASNNSSGKVYLYVGNGDGTFSQPFGYEVGPNPTAVVAADFNNDGYLDILTVSSSKTTTKNITVLPNNIGFGFNKPVYSSLGTGADNPLAGVAVVHLNQDPFADIIVTDATDPNMALLAQGSYVEQHQNNIQVLTGLGDGEFRLTSTDFTSGGSNLNLLPTSTVAVINDPFKPITTFTVVSKYVGPNLLANGSFSQPDLSNERGNLNGWSIYNQPDPNGGSSAGDWSVQTGDFSPLSNTVVPGPTVGNYQAMLDQSSQFPVFSTNFLQNPTNSPDTYAGSHALFETFTIPNNAEFVTLSMDLYIRSAAVWSDPIQNPYLNFTPLGVPNQQVRIDIVNPNDPNLLKNPLDVTTSIVKRIFQTKPGQSTTLDSSNINLVDTSRALSTDFVLDNSAGVDLSQFAGQTIELRIAATNNQGLLIVGVDNAKVSVDYNDFSPPGLSSINLRNPSYLSGPNVPEQGTDQTFVGQVTDANSINDLSTIRFNLTGLGFNVFGTGVVSTFDPFGNFSFTPQTPLAPGQYTLPYEIFDKAGNTATGHLTFIIQSPSLVTWEAQGPQQIDVSAASSTGVQYTTVSGQVTATALDPTDPSGNTFYVGSDNGGIWRTTDGGSDYFALTDNVNNSAGIGVPVPIASIGVGIDGAIYAATGVSFNTLTANSSIGILKSTDQGKTWFVVGDKPETATAFPGFVGAHISKLVLDNRTSGSGQVIYVSVAWWDEPNFSPGVFKSTDGGKTWSDVLTSANMYFPTGSQPGGTGGQFTLIPAGSTVAPVTDMIIDPFNPNRVMIGMGDNGHFTLPAAGGFDTRGVWLSTDGGITWFLQIGGDNTKLVDAAGNPNNRLPSGSPQPGLAAGTTIPGSNIGRITLAQGTGRVGDERYVYVLVSNPPGGSAETQPFTQGKEFGLFLTTDNLSNFTHVQLEQQIGVTAFTAINLLAEQGSSYASMAVDPTDPHVVYIGGSDLLPYDNALRQPQNFDQHALVRVDTGDIRGSTYVDPLRGPNPPVAIPNDGDDIQKAAEAEIQWIIQKGGGFPTNPPNYDPLGLELYPNGNTYNGEGVYWYDIQEGGDNQSNLINPGLNTTLRVQNLPGTVDSITIDAQGRVLFGTTGGLYRGLDRGFGYDFTTGQGNYVAGASGGILAQVGVTYQRPLGMQLTELNGNLQITDLTSVAIDPTLSGVFYTSEASTGSAVTSSGVTGWATMGLTGPTINTAPFHESFSTPNGYQVIASYTDGNLNASPIVTAPAGERTTVYRVWEKNTTGTPYTPYPLFSSLLVEVSHDGGLTFSPVDPNGISVNDTAQIAPVLAMNPVKIYEPAQGVYYDQLMFGTDRVYLTNTQGNIWDYESPILEPGGVGGSPVNISALAFAGPTFQGYYYAGLENGEIFYKGGPSKAWVNQGAAGLAPTGLPQQGGHITSLTVDPKHVNILYATFDSIVNSTGATPFVYRSSDYGKTWHPFIGNSGAPQIPSMSAYDFVINPAHTPAAPNGAFYVGTRAGVYTSINGGASWSLLGQGLPNAPVVGLQYNAYQQVLAVALQGRGVFTLSTRSLGPAVQGSATTPSTATTAPGSTATVTFDEQVQPSTFNTLGGSAARKVEVDNLLSSSEYLQDRVTQLFQEFLRRNPTSTELATYSSVLGESGGNGETDVIVALLSTLTLPKSKTVEYFANEGGNNNQTWLNQVFEDLLGRSAIGDPQANFYLQELITAQGSPPATFTLQQVVGLIVGTQKSTNPSALQLALTTEFQADQIARLANLYGGGLYDYSIPAPQNDQFIATWLNNFSEGMTVRNLIESLLDSMPAYQSLGNLTTTPTTNRTVTALGNFTGGTIGAAITSIGGTAGGPIVITTTSTANLATDQTVIISGVTGYTDGGGNPLGNGTFVITVVNGTTFTLNGTTATGAPDVAQTTAAWSQPTLDLAVVQLTSKTGTGMISSIGGTAGLPITITDASATNLLATGDTVTIAGVTGYPTANGTFTITVIDATHFTLNGTSATGSTVSQTGVNAFWTLSNSNIVIYKGIAGGGFNTTLPAAILPLPAGANPTQLVVADLNNDGMSDLIVANTGLTGAGGNSISVFLNNRTAIGQISFGVRQDYNGGNNPAAIAVASLDGGAIPDIIVADGTSVYSTTGGTSPVVTNTFDVTILVGKGDGTFDPTKTVIQPVGTLTTVNVTSTLTNTTTAGLTNPDALAVGNLGDSTVAGLADIVIAGSNGMLVLTNTTAGVGLTPSFSVPANMLSSLRITSLAIGPVDTNGTNDIVATSDSGGGEVLVYQNGGTGAGNGVFSSPTAISAGASPRDVQLVDVNGDGQLDIVLVNDTAPGAISIFINRGSSLKGKVNFPATFNNNPNTFSYPTTEASPAFTLNYPTSISIGSVASAGTPYVAVASQTGSVVLFGPVNALGTGNIDLPASTPAPLAVAYGDFSNVTDVSGNPVLDLAEAVSTGNGTYAVVIYQGIPGGGFSTTPAATLLLPAGANPTQLLVADLNQDGLADLVVANGGLSGPGSVSVFINNSPGIGQIGFPTNPVPYDGGKNPVALAVGNLDGNPTGILDLVVADGTAALDVPSGNYYYNITILPGNGDGTFGAGIVQHVGTPATLATSTTPAVGTTGLVRPTGIAIGNLGDAGGLPDIVVSGTPGADATGSGLLVLTNTTAGAGLTPTFTLPALPLDPTLAITSVAIGPIDTNASNDLVATTDSNGGEVLVYQNGGTGAGNGVFSGPTAFAAGQAPRSVQLVDLNGDGALDVVVVNDTAPGTVTSLTNTTVTAAAGPDTVTFSTTTSNIGVGTPTSLAVASTPDPNNPGSFIVQESFGSQNGASQVIGPFTGSSLSTYGLSSTTVALGHFTGTAFLDLAVAERDSNGNAVVAIYPGTASGAYAQTPALLLPLPASANPVQLLVADLNGDGQADIVVANSGLTSATGNSISVFLNGTQSAGQLAFTRYDYDGGNNPSAITLANLDGNSKGLLDLVVVDGTADTTADVNGNFNFDVKILTSNSDGTFNAANTIGVGTTRNSPGGATGLLTPTGVAVGDLGDGNGLPDIVVSGAAGNNASATGVPASSIIVLTNQTLASGGQLTFVPLATPMSILNTTSVAIGPLDTTGVNDIVVTTGKIGGQILIFQNLGGDTYQIETGSTYAKPTVVSVGGNPRDVQLVDLNQYAKVDEKNIDDILFVNDNTSGSLNVLRNITVPTTSSSSPDAITFATKAAYPSLASDPTSFALGDVNNDGVLDAVLASTAANDFAFVFGNTPGTFQSPSDARWVNYAYETLLGRTAKSSELTGAITTITNNEEVYLSGPNGTVAPLSIVPDPNDLTGTVFDLTFPPLNADANYKLVVQATKSSGNQIKDFIDQNGTFVNLGNAFNQNANTVNGQFGAAPTGDRYTGTLAVSSNDDAQYISGLYHDLLGASTSTTVTFTYQSGSTNRTYVTDINTIEPARLQALQSVAGNLISTPISSVGGTKGLPVVVTAPTFDLSTGDSVTIYGVTGYTLSTGNINSTFTITVIDANHFALNGTVASGKTSKANTGSFVDNTLGTPFRPAAVISIYLTYLGRMPTSGSASSELETALANLAAGKATEESLIISLLISPEYIGGLSSGDWLNKLYQSLLGVSDAADLTNPTSLASKSLAMLTVAKPSALVTTMQKVATNILDSTPALERILTPLFEALYHRAPLVNSDPALDELTPYVNLLKKGPAGAGKLTPYEQVVAMMVSTPEYLSLAGDSNKGWATKVYQDVVGISMATATSSAFIPKLNATVTQVLALYAKQRLSVVTAITGSLQYRYQVYTQYYKTYFSTPNSPYTPTNADLASAEKIYQTHGKRLEAVLATILAASQFKPLNAASSFNLDWIQTVYGDLLSRAPVNTNKTYQSQLATLAKAKTPTQVATARYNVALQILNSTEFRGDLIAGFFNKFIINSVPTTDTQNSFANPAVGLYSIPFVSDVVLNQNAQVVNNYVIQMSKGMNQETVLANILVNSINLIESDNIGNVVKPVLNYLQNPHQFP
jgi:hypothetical protein